MTHRPSLIAQAAPRALLAICLLTALPGCAWLRSHLPASMGGTPAEVPAGSGGTAAIPAGGAVTAPVGTPASTSALASPSASPSASPPPAQ